MALGGRASEQINFGSVTTGAQDDLRKVTQIIYSTIQDFGMNEKIGQLCKTFSIFSLQQTLFLSWFIAFPSDPNAMGMSEKKYSEALAQTMDEEAKKVVDQVFSKF